MQSTRALVLALLLGAVIVSCLAGCAGRQAAEGTGETTIGLPVGAATQTGPYRLRVGDLVAVDFLTDEELDFSGPVTPSGGLSVPLIGDVQAANRTVAELASDIESRMGQYLLDGRVSVTIEEIAEQPVFVIGEVDRPGRIESSGAMTVTRAIAAAGGMLSTGKPGSVMVIRTTGVAEPEAYKVDVADFLSGRDLGADMALAPNDVVYVPKSVIGKVGEFVELFFTRIAPAQLFYLRGYQMANTEDLDTWLY